MAILMVREPSETPNITNVDDFVGLRYAYGGQDGYVKDFGNNCSYAINGNVLHINSGRLVLQGVECDIDANGVDITIDSVSTTRYYVVYLQVNLSTNQVSIRSTHLTSSYPTISVGDDLTQNTSGTANMPIYKFSATNGTISNVVKLVKEIKYISNDAEVTALKVKAELGVYSPLTLQTDSADYCLTGYKSGGNYLGLIGCDTNKKPVFYNTETDVSEKLIRDVDLDACFNTTEQTKFGDYIIPKKKLIWSGNQTAARGGRFLIPGLNLSIGDTIEVYFKNNQTKNQEVKIKIYISFADTRQEGVMTGSTCNFCNLIYGGSRYAGTATNVNRMIGIKAYNYTDGQLRIGDAFYLDVGYVSSADDPVFFTTEPCDETTFTKIYKIYE